MRSWTQSSQRPGGCPIDENNQSEITPLNTAASRKWCGGLPWPAIQVAAQPACAAAAGKVCRRVAGLPCNLPPCFPPCCACRGVVAALHHMGMHCVLLTGDNWRTARAIGDQVGGWLQSCVLCVLAAPAIWRGEASQQRPGKGWLSRSVVGCVLLTCLGWAQPPASPLQFRAAPAVAWRPILTLRLLSPRYPCQRCSLSLVAFCLLAAGHPNRVCRGAASRQGGQSAGRWGRQCRRDGASCIGRYVMRHRHQLA